MASTTPDDSGAVSAVIERKIDRYGGSLTGCTPAGATAEEHT